MWIDGHTGKEKEGWQTDIKKLTVAFRNLAKTPKNFLSSKHETELINKNKGTLNLMF